MSYGFLIPVYNHGASAYQEVQELLRYGLPVILVDDASDQENKEWLRKCEALSGLVHLVTLEKNLGKGGAHAGGPEPDGRDVPCSPELPVGRGAEL